MKNIKVIYGGSFNPPTIAHFMIAKTIIEEFKVTDFVFLPNGDNYKLKDISDYKSRYEMCLIMCKYLKNATVSDFEAHNPEFRGIDYILKHFPNYFFLMGSDCLNDIKNWINFPEVVKKNKFIIIKRNNDDFEKILVENNLCQYKEHFYFIDNLDMNILNISSSQYRQTKDESLLLPDVRKYIKEHNVYFK